jgi:hypothetical protein
MIQSGWTKGLDHPGPEICGVTLTLELCELSNFTCRQTGSPGEANDLGVEMRIGWAVSLLTPKNGFVS